MLLPGPKLLPAQTSPTSPPNRMRRELGDLPGDTPQSPTLLSSPQTLEVQRSRSFSPQAYIQLQGSLCTYEGQKLGINVKS